MSALRLVSLPTHAVLELLGGIALLGVPFVLGFGTAGTIVAFILGVLAIGTALEAADGSAIARHAAFDQSLVVALLAAAVALTLAGDQAAGAVLLVAGLAQLTLVATTRYTRPGERRSRSAPRF